MYAYIYMYVRVSVAHVRMYYCSYLHKSEIVHGNLSLASIFIQHDGLVKIGSGALIIWGCAHAHARSHTCMFTCMYVL